MAVHPHVKKILIIGGGDGGVAREFAAYPEIEEIDVVEPDEQMVEVLRKNNAVIPFQWLVNLDVSLGELKGLPNAQRDALVNYLKDRTIDPEKVPMKYYLQAIAVLENKEGIQFQDLTFDEALKRASKEGKMVFMDCYTIWCGPCKMMNEKVFTQKVVGDFFKKHFISLKVDMEKGEGIELGKRFDVRAYPTMFIFDANGNIIHRLQGARGVEDFMNEIQKGLNN